MVSTMALVWTVINRAERQSARMSKITNEGLTRCGTECFIAVPTWQQWASKILASGQFGTNPAKGEVW